MGLLPGTDLIVSSFLLQYIFSGQKCNFSSLLVIPLFLCVFFISMPRVLIECFLCSSQLVNHGISDELLERVKKVSSECFKLEREEEFKKSALVKSLNGQKLENVDWEDVFTLLDDNEWPSKTPGFK